MDTKLTLNLDKEVIEKAKQYAKSNRISLSRLVESYFETLTKDQAGDVEITPLVKSLSGVIKVDKDYDNRDDYADFLTEKYK